MSGVNGDAETSDDADVMEEQFVGAALGIVQGHVQEVVHEVPDGEGDQHVGGVVVGVNHVVAHVLEEVKLITLYYDYCPILSIKSVDISDNVDSICTIRYYYYCIKY